MTEELYSEILLDHNKSPRCSKPLSDFDVETEAHNPLCGDKVQVQIKFEGDRIKDVAIISTGCAISIASGSMLAGQLSGKTVDEARKISQDFRDMILKGANPSLGELEALKSVKEFPMRVKCATMVHHALLELIDDRDKSVSDCSESV